MTWFSRFR